MTELALPDLARAIDREHEAATAAAKTALEHAFECGRLLLEAKEQVKHGEWLPWVEANLSFGDRQARKYMRLADHADQIGIQNSDLTVDGALALLAKPSPRDRNRDGPKPEPKRDRTPSVVSASAPKEAIPQPAPTLSDRDVAAPVPAPEPINEQLKIGHASWADNAGDDEAKRALIAAWRAAREETRRWFLELVVGERPDPSEVEEFIRGFEQRYGPIKPGRKVELQEVATKQKFDRVRSDMEYDSDIIEDGHSRLNTCMDWAHIPHSTAHDPGRVPGPTDHLLVIERERRLDHPDGHPDGPDSKIAFESPAGDQEPTSSTEPESSESETAVGADDPALPAEVTGRVVTSTPRGWHFYAGQETGRPVKLEDRDVVSEKDGGGLGAVYQMETPGRYVWVSSGNERTGADQ